MNIEATVHVFQEALHERGTFNETLARLLGVNDCRYVDGVEPVYMSERVRIANRRKFRSIISSKYGVTRSFAQVDRDMLLQAFDAAVIIAALKDEDGTGEKISSFGEWAKRWVDPSTARPKVAPEREGGRAQRRQRAEGVLAPSEAKLRAKSKRR